MFQIFKFIKPEFSKLLRETGDWGEGSEHCNSM